MSKARAKPSAQALAKVPAPDNNVIATTRDGRDITRPYVDQMLRLMPQDSVLLVRGGANYELYRQVLTDETVGYAFNQRRQAVTSLEWTVDAGGDAPIDKEAADFIKEQVGNIGWDNLTDKMLFGVFYGYSVAECLWARKGAQVVLNQIRVRDRRRFAFDPEFQLRLLTVQSPLQGELMPGRKFWTFCTGGDHDDDPYGLGLAHWLYWPVLFKRRGIQFWLRFLDKFGSPTAKGTFPAGTSDPDKQRLLDALQAIQTDAAIIIPEGMVAELLEAARSGTADYDKLCSRMDDAIMRVVLGQTLSGNARSTGLGSGVAELQNEVRKEVVQADADLVCDSFRKQVVTWLCEWNFPGAAVPKVWRPSDEPEDINAASERDQRLAEIGWFATDERMRETYGEGYMRGTPLGKPAAPADGAQGAAFAETDLPPDPPSRMAGQLDANLQPAMDDWIGKIRALVMRAKDLEEVRDGLAALAPDMSLDQYTAAMRQALAAAALAGRYEILREAGTP